MKIVKKVIKKIFDRLNSFYRDEPSSITPRIPDATELHKKMGTQELKVLRIADRLKEAGHFSQGLRLNEAVTTYHGPIMIDRESDALFNRYLLLKQWLKENSETLTSEEMNEVLLLIEDIKNYRQHPMWGAVTTNFFDKY